MMSLLYMAEQLTQEMQESPEEAYTMRTGAAEIQTLVPDLLNQVHGLIKLGYEPSTAAAALDLWCDEAGAHLAGSIAVYMYINEQMSEFEEEQ